MSELFGSKTEEKILKFWKREQIFEKSLTLRQAHGKGKFIFYEGPPSANGRPGIHHVLSRVYKDIICRYKTMAGFYVPRKAGWDTHGLPIELQVEKELGLKNKKDIEKYGIGRFNEKARETVWRYKKDWDKLTGRIGFWLDLKNPYITYEPHYIESLWHLIAKIARKKLLYQDFKVVPYCPRCGTALSSHEVALGYEKIVENSVYIKFKLKAGQKIKTDNGEYKTTDNAYILSWTTTPWTLPGNVALAVGEKINYEILTLKNGGVFIFAKNLKNAVDIEELKEKSAFTFGKNLIGLRYEPLFGAPQLKSKASYKVYAADFVNTEEGTGVVHTAVMYGEDDFNLGKKVGLPKVHTVDLEGKFISDFGAGLKGFFVKSAPAENLIINYLKSKNNLLKVKKYEHDYPFCWRCESPLLYYAKTSRFIKMEKLKKKLIINNKKINWIPAHIKYGRFGEWLSEIKDWAISRERYWGTPLPLWQCQKCKCEKIVGSLEELDNFDPAPTILYIMRHGEALHNIRLTVNPDSLEADRANILTERGKKDILRNAKKLKKEKINVIVSSPSFRARETARIVGRAIDIKQVRIIPELRDIISADFAGKSLLEFKKSFYNFDERFYKKPGGAENLRELRSRVMTAAAIIRRHYAGKRVLVLTHGDPSWILMAAISGISEKDYQNAPYIQPANYRKIYLHNWPYNEKGDLDLHRPYADDIKLRCKKCGGKMERVKEVIDVWFDSGAMPFAQLHYPFSCAQNQKSKIKNQNKCLEYPADFISEGVDQTRGWFYTLHAVGALMGRGPAYKNVISLGHILDEKGEKMSKSKGNVVDPWEVINKYGADALRWYFFTVNPPGEPKRFAARDVEDKLRRFILTLSNVLIFYKTYAAKGQRPKAKGQNLLDKWIFSRLNQTIKIAGQNLDRYEVTAGARSIDEFIDDLSRWWLRRSRKRFSGEDAKTASAILKEILETLARLIAPFTPFLAEHIWQSLGNKGSVHLEEYPKPQAKYINPELEKQMASVRGAAARGLALRAEAGVKVRQPLALLKIKSKISNLKINDELLNLIKDEVNVKEIIFDKNIKNDFELDATITGELKEEGRVRDLTRQIQEMRKDALLAPKDFIKIYFKTDDAKLADTIKKWQKILMKGTGSKEIEFIGAIKDGLTIDRHFELENRPIWIGIQFFNTKYHL